MAEAEAYFAANGGFPGTSPFDPETEFDGPEDQDDDDEEEDDEEEGEESCSGREAIRRY